ncbi:hypothetical protein VBD025_08620 [Virgibacillus flavescens]
MSTQMRRNIRNRTKDVVKVGLDKAVNTVKSGLEKMGNVIEGLFSW